MTQKFLHKLRSEVLYLLEDETDIVVKSLPTGEYFSRYMGGNEGPLEPSSEIVTRAIHAASEVTKKDYDNGYQYP
ncbi:hypothetical protein MD537_06855 [Flavihumibacter sediminis]|nr:hypothetical protein [Flavihumibacter sediminis]